MQRTANQWTLLILFLLEYLSATGSIVVTEMVATDRPGISFLFVRLVVPRSSFGSRRQGPALGGAAAGSSLAATACTTEGVEPNAASHFSSDNA